MEKKQKITVYSTPTCPYCVTLKNYLKEKGFEVEDIDVSKDETRLEEMIKKSGQMGVPVVDINGKIVVSFDKKLIDELLGIKE
jgi:glutaredoxin 3